MNEGELRLNKGKEEARNRGKSGKNLWVIVIIRGDRSARNMADPSNPKRSKGENSGERRGEEEDGRNGKFGNRLTFWTGNKSTTKKGPNEFDKTESERLAELKEKGNCLSSRRSEEGVTKTSGGNSTKVGEMTPNRNG